MKMKIKTKIIFETEIDRTDIYNYLINEKSWSPSIVKQQLLETEELNLKCLISRFELDNIDNLFNQSYQFSHNIEII